MRKEIAMKKSRILIPAILATLLIVALVAGCSTSSGSNQTPATVTVTATTTVTVTPAPVTVTVTPEITPTQTTPTPTFNEMDINNNPHFFFSKEITGYSTPVVLVGTPTPSPTYKENYLDLDLGGFFTNRDAYFDPRIPEFTNHDDWFYIFQLPVYKFPWIMNWGYITKSNSPDTTLTLSVYKKDVLANYYNKFQNIAAPPSLGQEKAISSSGVHCLQFNDSGTFVVLVKTNNADDIAGWWAKYGGEKYGQ
jgi:hypothetical protein